MIDNCCTNSRLKNSIDNLQPKLNADFQIILGAITNWVTVHSVTSNLRKSILNSLYK